MALSEQASLALLEAAQGAIEAIGVAIKASAGLPLNAVADLRVSYAELVAAVALALPDE